MPRQPSIIVAIGDRFGSLEFIGPIVSTSEGRLARCRCDCGTEVDYFIHDLKRRISCGCLAGHRSIKNRLMIKGESRSRLYKIWAGMKNRCHCRSSQAWGRYGALGIEVCEEWRDSFVAFRDWSLANGYRPGLTIDRRNNDRGYSPENCRWCAYAEQLRNQVRNVMIEAFGERKCLNDWVADPRCTVPSGITIARRIAKGVDAEAAITLPSHKGKPLFGRSAF